MSLTKASKTTGLDYISLLRLERRLLLLNLKSWIEPRKAGIMKEPEANLGPYILVASIYNAADVRSKKPKRRQLSRTLRGTLLRVDDDHSNN